MAWTPSYCTTAEAREFVTANTSTVDDTWLALAISAASRAVDRHTNRQFGVVASAEERFYTAAWDRRRCRWIVPVDDFMSTTGLAVEVDGTALTGFTKEPVNAAAEGKPWTQLVVDTDSTVVPTGADHEVAVTALWGWSSVPDPVKHGTLLQVSRLSARRTSPFGVAGSPDVGSEIRLLARLDPDVAVSLGPFVRWWAAA